MTAPIQPSPNDATLPPSGKHLPATPVMKSRDREYELAGEVARGGMGAILRANDRNIKRTVAMKVVLEAAAGDEDALRRFTQEAELTGQLEHPNIVPVHDLSFDEQGRPFYTMKFVKGVTLHEILAMLKEGEPAAVAQYSLASLLTIFQKVCDAVAFAHSKQVIHRDLKPANIMVGEYGEVLVMDWGLAKVVREKETADRRQEAEVPGPESGERSTQRGWAKVSDLAPPATEGLAVAPETCGQKDGAVRDRRQTESRVERPGAGFQLSTLNPQPSAGTRPPTLTPQPALTLAGSIMGSPQYMAPEQAAGELDKLDARTDIFALGGILYNILTLHPPVSGETVVEMLEQILAGAIMPPSSYNAKTGRKLGGTIKVGAKTFPQPPLIPLRHCPGGRIPESLAAVAMKALALRQDDRYQSVVEFQKDIEAYQGGFATGAEKAGAWRQAALLVKRHKKEFALAAVAVVVLLGTVTGFLVKVTKEKNRAEIEKQHAQTERDRAERTLVELRKTAPTFYAQAQVLIEQRQWPEAMEKASFAAALAPEVADYQVLHGNLLQTSLQMTNARGAYAAALKQQPNHQLAQENLELCQAFLRDENGPQRLADLQLIETAMLRQGRTAEAGAFMRFIEKETTNRVEVLHAWWKFLVKAGSDDHYLYYGDGLTFGMAGRDYTNETLALFQGMPLNHLQVGERARKIRDLRPMQGMPLHHLVLREALVTDLSPLQGMQLRFLDLERCRNVSDLTPLRGMPLETLDIGGCAISNLNLLQGMPLTTLRIGFTKVTDLTPLAGMRLTELDISFTKISDLSPLRGMPLKFLYVNGTLVSDLSPLKGMPLEELDIRGIPIKDFGPLHGMPLTDLMVDQTGIDDLTPLMGLPLKRLVLWCPAVTDLSPLRGLPFQKLDLRLCAKLQDLTPLLDCQQLTSLIIPSTCKNIDCLRSHPTLKEIRSNVQNGGWDQLLPVAKFWKEYDAPKTNAPAATPKR